MGTPLATTPADFEGPGTQPLTISEPIQTSQSCASCHGGFNEATEPWTRWQHSLMGQSARDPIFHAALAIAEQDAPASGELCIRCHAPGGWLEGRGTPSDGSALFGKDFEGVACHVCHRMVDPVPAAENPGVDASILAALTTQVPSSPHSAQYVIDPQDRRRGPFKLPVFFAWHSWLESPFHQESLLCATCHDVSNPAFERVGGATPAASDTYALGDLGQPHSNHDKYDEFPLERTFSEWAQSAFAQGPIDLGGKFGGNKTHVSSCQDCHMPDVSGEACAPGFDGAFRTDLPAHDLNGANSWVLNAILDLDQSLLLYGPSEVSGMNAADVAAAVQRNISMLERASELELSLDGDRLGVRIYNDTGHKLPTGYGEGRRMWINVQFRDSAGVLVGEHGHYDAVEADLTTLDTKVYEILHGMDPAVSALTGLPAGESFHFVLNNTVVKDNRIPPRGFTNAGFDAVQAMAVGASYADGQYWDDTHFPIPCRATAAQVRVFHQTTSKEYIEFLRDENTTNDRGQIAYDLWNANGRSAPVLMESATFDLTPRLVADINTISLQAGGEQRLCISGGIAWAGQQYWVLGSVSGITPGFPLDGLVVPLNFDAYTALTIMSPNQGPLVNTLGALDALGESVSAFNLPSGTVSPGTLGLIASHAAVLFDPVQFQALAVTNPVLLKFTP